MKKMKINIIMKIQKIKKLKIINKQIQITIMIYKLNYKISVMIIFIKIKV